MDDAFCKKVKEDLENSGFKSEMKIIRGFRKSNWTCEGGAAYFDRDENKTREIDAVGYHHVRKEIAKDLFAASWFYVVAEVKRSHNPWVVFREPLSAHPLPMMDAWSNLAQCDGFTEMRVGLALGLSQHSLLCELGWRGYAVMSASKIPERHQDGTRHLFLLPRLPTMCSGGIHNTRNNAVKTMKPFCISRLRFISSSPWSCLMANSCQRTWIKMARLFWAKSLRRHLSFIFNRDSTSDLSTGWISFSWNISPRT